MDWNTVLQAEVKDVEKEEALLEDLYAFFNGPSLPQSVDEAPPELQEKPALLKLTHVLRTVMKMKGLEVEAMEEELRDLQDQCESLTSRVGGGSGERDLVEEVVRLEKELRMKEDMLERLREEQTSMSVSPSKMLELRHMRDELEDLKAEREELKRFLSQEQDENRKHLEKAAADRLKHRQLERELETMKHNLEENTKTLEWHRGQERAKGKEADFRERLRKKTSEMESLESMVQELLRKRNELEEGMRQMLEELVEERELKLAAINNKTAMEKALVQSDANCDELESQKNLLMEQNKELQLQLGQRAAENEEAFSILSKKAPKWEQALETKEKELVKCREKILQLEGLVQGSQVHHGNQVTAKTIKKALEKREAELAAMQEELTEATQHISDLATELEAVRGRGDPALVKSAMKQELERAQAKVALLEKDLALEVHRREQAEADNEGQDEKMTLALGELGKYERGDYGLREAVMEIKVKKKELSLRDRDIAELTQHVNQLENELNQFSEENEALRDRLGLGEEEEVDVTQVREKRRSQIIQLQKDCRELEKEVERLREENVSLRRRNLEFAVNSSPSSHHLDSDSVDLGSRDPQDLGSHDQRSHDPRATRHKPAQTSSNLLSESSLRSKVRLLEKACEDEQRGKEAWRAKAEEAREKLKKSQFRLKSVEAVLKEMHGQDRGRGSGDIQGDQKSPPTFSREALDRLIALLESEGGLGNSNLKMSELKGQNEVLSQQLQRAEQDTKSALRELERKQCEVETLTKDVAVLRKQMVGFRPVPLPEGLPLSSSEVITSLNEQLLHALQQLHGREEELEVVRGSLDGLQRKFAVVMHQLGTLYQEHVEKNSQWEGFKKEMEEERQKVLEERSHDKVKVQELELLQAALAGDGEDELKKVVGEMSRRLTVIQVKEQQTGRKAQLLQEREAALRKENTLLRKEKVQVEKVITERMAYLQRYKETALYKLRSLQQELSRSVPCGELDKVNSQCQQLAVKYEHLLNQQNAYTATTATVDQLKAEIRTLTDQLEEVKAELSAEKNKNRLLEESAAGVISGRGVSGGEGGGVSNQVATLEMKALNATQRAELASVRYQQLQEVVLQLEQRNETLEGNFSELTQRLLQTQASEAELRDQLASALPGEKQEELENRISELAKSEAHLTISNNQLKEVAEVARQQAIAMETMQKSRDLELVSLRHQLLDLQSTNDEKTALGRVHHQLLSSQVSEAAALKNLEVADTKVIKLEASLLRSERERIRESENVFKVGAEANGKTKQLRETIQFLRRQYAGCVPLLEHENFVFLLQKARENKMEADKLRKEAKHNKEELEDKLQELGVQKKNLEELLSSLQALTSDPQLASATARMVEWHSKLGELRLAEMRLTRANQRQRERLAQLEGLVGSGEKEFSKLEQRLIALTKEYEGKQLSWEQRESQLEKQIEEVKTSLPVRSGDMTMPLSENSPQQLQDALVQLQESAREKNMLSQHLQKKEKEAGHLEVALGQLRQELAQKEDEMVLVRRDSEKLRKINLLTAAEKEEDERLLKMAQETSRQLKIRLSEKEEVAEKYQAMLQDARKELQREVAAHKQEVAALRTKLHSQEDHNFSKLKSEALEAARSPTPPPLATDKQLERLLVLEDLTASQEEEAKRLCQRLETEEEESRGRVREYESLVKSLQEEARDNSKRHTKEMEELRGSLSEAKVRVNELEQEVEVLEGELSAAQDAAKKAPSRTLRSLVERLRNQLAIKEKQQRALSEALLQVRADLVETAQRTLEGEDERAAQEKSIRELVTSKTQQLQEQMDDLKQQLSDVEEERDACESRERESSEKMKRLHGEVRAKEREVREARLHVEEQASALVRAKSSEDQLTKRIQQLEKEPSVFVLQRRVKSLQDKVENQKSKIKELEGELQTRIAREQKLLAQGSRYKTRELLSGAPQGDAHAGDKATMTTTQPDIPSGGAAAAAAGDRMHQAMQVIRWEEGKKWQKKMSGVRVKLEEKTRELEASQKQVTGLKELQARCDRERIALNSKVRSLQKQLGELQEKVREPSEANRHSVQELERVISAMRKVIDKLQGENEKLKRKRVEAGLPISKGSDKLLEENKKLKFEVQELQMSKTAPPLINPTRSPPYQTLISENEKLKRELKAELLRSEKLQQSLSSTQLQSRRVSQDVHGSRSSPIMTSDTSMRDMELKVRVEELQAELEKKTAMLVEVKRHLKNAAERENTSIVSNSKYLSVVKERDLLKEETEKLRKELDAFDPAFFEEIEDLKFNYQEAVKKNVRLEAQLSRLAAERGSPTTTATHRTRDS